MGISTTEMQHKLKAMLADDTGDESGPLITGIITGNYILYYDTGYREYFKPRKYDRVGWWKNDG